MRTASRLILSGAFLSLSSIAHGQAAPIAHAAKSPMQQHYEAAFRFQNAGNLSQADSEYKLFLAMVLHRIANGDARLGEYALAAPLFEEALRFNPDDPELQLDYSGAALDAADWNQAKASAASMLELLKRNGQPPDLRAVSALARALLELGDHRGALEQYKLANRLHPDFDTSAELASAYLVMGDSQSATKVLNELVEKSGDTAILHLKLGTVYGKVNFFAEAIDEFRKALAKDPGLKGAHYSLGASYMMQSGDIGFDRAEAEFRKEIALDPDNALVYGPLGRIALSRHKYSEAESDLKHAIALKQANAGVYLAMGELYKEEGNVTAAETAFRKGIALTLDPSRNAFEVERAHFWLGRLLVQNGNPDEGRKELDISRSLLYLKELEQQARMSGELILQLPLARTREASPQDLAAQKMIVEQAAPVIASSYDNLGTNAANSGDYVRAFNYFRQAAQWNPALRNVFKNWSRAAFAAREYAQAVEPLRHELDQSPADSDVRAMLGFSLCISHNYAKALEVMQPIEPNLDANPQLAIAYAGSMAIAEDYSQGMARLKKLENANPGAALVHYLIGEAYASKGDYAQSASELHIALSLEPSNAETEDALALADIALGEKAEALQLLSQIAASRSADGEVFNRLAQLQIELGSTQAAIESLNAAINLKPMDAAYHQALAEAYRRNAQPEEADREARQSQILLAQIESNRQSESSNSGIGDANGDTSKAQNK